MLEMSTQHMTREIAQKLSMAEQHEWFQQRRSRRTFLKAGLATAGATLAVPTLLGGRAGAAETVRGSASISIWFPSSPPSSGPAVVPFGRHISFGADPNGTMNIVW